jgi:hypothetical protein
MTTTTSPGDALRTKAREKGAEFLLEEYKLITDSLLRNEESGEKRAAFFMTLAGAAGAVVAFAFDGEHSLVEKVNVPAVAAGVAALLLFLGVMTVRRLAVRHVATDRFIFELRDLRRTFISKADADAMPNSFFRIYDEPDTGKGTKREQRYISFGKGGWLECVAAVNAILGSVCLGGIFKARGFEKDVWLTAAILAGIYTWVVQIYFATRYVMNETRVLRDADAAHIAQALRQEREPNPCGNTD